MKKMTKVSLIIASICMGLGILMVLIGLMMGADRDDLNDMGIYISLSPMLHKNESGRMEFKISNEEHHGDKETAIKGHHNSKAESYHLQELDRLEVDVENASITIKTSEDEETITFISNYGDIGRTEGRTLKLENHGRGLEKLELEIYLPVNGMKEIEIEASACELKADKIIADTVSLEVGSASVRIEELLVRQNAKLELSAGEMVIGYYEGNNLEAECDMGVIDVLCEGDSKDYNYELECGMGNIRINDESYSGIGEKVRVNNGSQKNIYAECSMGEIVLEFPGRL